MGRFQLGDEASRLLGRAARKREQQEPLGAEPLREGTRRDAGFLCDLSERELARSQAIRGAVRGGEDLLVADFPGSWAH